MLQAIDIYVDGANVGPASKYNAWPNKERALPVGRPVVQFVRISDDTIVYETTALIDSRYAMRGEPNRLRIDENRILNGPFRKRIQHQYNDELPQLPPEQVLRRPGGN